MIERQLTKRWLLAFKMTPKGMGGVTFYVLAGLVVTVPKQFLVS